MTFYGPQAKWGSDVTRRIILRSDTNATNPYSPGFGQLSSRDQVPWSTSKFSKNYNRDNPLPPVRKIESEVRNSDMSCWQPSRIRWCLPTGWFLGTPDAEPNRYRALAREPPEKKKKEKKSFHPNSMIVLVIWIDWEIFKKKIAKSPPYQINRKNF